MKPRKKLSHYNIPGHAHHLTFSCQHHLPLLKSARTCGWFVKALVLACQKWDYARWAYVIMPEHVHLLVYPRRELHDLAQFLQTLKQSVAQRAIIHLQKNAISFLNKLEVGKGHYQFWLQSAGYDHNLFEPTAIQEVIDYIHNNPVRRGLVACPEDWHWSSAKAWATGIDEPISIDRDVPPIVTR